MELDAEDLELLGWGADALEFEYAVGISTAHARQKAGEHERNAYAYWKITPRKNLERLKAWRRAAPEKYRAIERRYKQSPKGRAMKSAANRRYYLRKKAEREAQKQDGR